MPKAKPDSPTLTPAPYNPRRITDGELAALGRSMKEFGDLSGVVYNRRSGFVIGGHQRLKHLTEGVTIETRFDEPTPTGTVAEGYIEHGGERWHFRMVDWDEDKERAANVAANKHGGAFDDRPFAELLQWLYERDFDLSLAGVTDDEYRDLLDRTADPDWQQPKQERLDKVRSAAFVRPVIAVEDVQVVEDAFAATGVPNRADAFLAICRHYLGR